MMLDEIDAKIGDLVLSDEQTVPRSPGIHVTDVVDYLSKSIGRRNNDFTDEQLNRFAVIGRLWESQLAREKFKPPRYVRPGEIELDGIIGSPDAVDADDWSVQEYKCTWRSSNRDIRTEFEWWCQIKAYCFMLGTTRAGLYALYVCGDWRPPIPEAKAWRVGFTLAELSENWAMLTTNAKAIMRMDQR